jgi:hypothetical protein
MKEKKNLIINKKIIDESINLYYNINNISKLNLLRLQLQVFISKHHGHYSVFTRSKLSSRGSLCYFPDLQTIFQSTCGLHSHHTISYHIIVVWA